MSAACLCPALPEFDHVGAGPIVCICCGQPLVLTCPGECGEQHVRQSIARAVPRRVASTAPTPARRPALATHEKKPRVYKPKPCRSCATVFTPTGPRDDRCKPCRGGKP